MIYVVFLCLVLPQLKCNKIVMSYKSSQRLVFYAFSIFPKYFFFINDSCSSYMIFLSLQNALTLFHEQVEGRNSSIIPCLNYLIGTGKVLKKEKAMSLAHLLFTCLDWQYYTTAPQTGCAQYVMHLLPLENIWWNFRICTLWFPTMSETKYVFLTICIFLMIYKS